MNNSFKIRYPELLKEDLTIEEAKIIQKIYSKLLYEECVVKPQIVNINKIRYIVGLDISYFFKDNTEYGIACAVFWDLKENKLINYTFSQGSIKFPYQPGLLGFRECSLLAQSINRLKTVPELLLCDGHGKIHPLFFGEATQLGFAVDIPSIGLAKKPFVGYSKWTDLKRIKGYKTPVWSHRPEKNTFKPPELLGYATCLNNRMKPIFISIGYKLSINSALEVALKTSINHRQPEPLYLAHKFAKEKAKEWREKSACHY